MYLLLEISTVTGGPIEPLYKRSKEQRIIGEIGKKERKWERKNQEAEEFHRLPKHTRERKYAIEALRLLNLL